MAEVIWAEPALHDLNAIADYIALDDPPAARGLVLRVFEHGSRPPEMRKSRYRQIVEAPCRVFYRYDGSRVFILYVLRGEKRYRQTRLNQRDRENRKIS